MSDDKIKIRIYASQRVRYSRDVMMPRAAFEEYERNCENGTRDKWFADFAETWLLGDDDAYDWAGYEDVEATPVDEVIAEQGQCS